MVLLITKVVCKAFSDLMLISLMNILIALVPIYSSAVYISFLLYNLLEIRVKYIPNHSKNVTGKEIKSPWSLKTYDDYRRPKSKTNYVIYVSLDL